MAVVDWPPITENKSQRIERTERIGSQIPKPKQNVRGKHWKQHVAVINFYKILLVLVEEAAITCVLCLACVVDLFSSSLSHVIKSGDQPS